MKAVRQNTTIWIGIDCTTVYGKNTIKITKNIGQNIGVNRNHCH